MYRRRSVVWLERLFRDAKHFVSEGVNSTANASYSGQSYTGFLTAGYHFFAQGFTLTPLASLQYTHLSLDNYMETGAGSLDLSVNSQSYDFLESGLGARVAHPFAYGDGNLVPELPVIFSSGFGEIDNPMVQKHGGICSRWLLVIYNSGVQGGGQFVRSRRRSHIAVVRMHRQNMVFRSDLRPLLEKPGLRSRSGDSLKATLRF